MLQARLKTLDTYKVEVRSCGVLVQAFLIQHEANAVEFMGNRTECALLMLLRGWGLRYEDIRSAHKGTIFQVYNFSSERKMASVLLRHGDGLRLYNKVCCSRLVAYLDDGSHAGDDYSSDTGSWTLP